MVAWVKMIAVDEATGELEEMYELARTPHGTVDNVMRVHSLRPHTMKGHITLYRSVLHNPENVLPFWFLEVVASYTSHLNQCDYSFSHHFTNARNLINDEEKSALIMSGFEQRDPSLAFDGKFRALLNYTEKLTVNVGQMKKSDYDCLIAAGCDDGEILEVNQVVGYFNYSNRLLNGLGVTTEGDTVGYYKMEEE